TGVEHGIDTFDCVHPTRLARHGGALVPAGPGVALDDAAATGQLNLRNTRFKDDASVIDSTCSCHTCQNYSRAYLHHLFKAGELLGLQLVTLHNIAFMNRLLAAIRTSIAEDRFAEEKKFWLAA